MLCLKLCFVNVNRFMYMRKKAINKGKGSLELQLPGMNSFTVHSLKAPRIWQVCARFWGLGVGHHLFPCGVYSLLRRKALIKSYTNIQ